MTRIRTVDTRRDMERLTDHYVSKGYRVRKSTPEEAVVREAGTGNIWWHVLFLFTTAGFGNLLYLLWSFATADMVKIRVTGSE